MSYLEKLDSLEDILAVVTGTGQDLYVDGGWLSNFD